MRRPSSRWAIISLLIVAVIIFGIVSYVWNSAVDVFQPANANGAGNPVSVTIVKGETTTQIADDLQSKGLIRNALAFRVWARIKGLDTHLQSGVYKKLNASMTISDITDKLLNAQPDDTRILVKEGWRIEQIAQAFDNANPKLIHFNADDFLKYTKHIDQFPDANKFPLLAKRPAEQNTMEGFLFPATYDVPVESDTTYVVDLLLKTMTDTAQQQNLEGMAQQHQMNFYQLLTLASVVERETGNPKYRNDIAAIYWNRLYTDFGKAETAGLLQADPTVQYGRDSQTLPQTYWAPLGASGNQVATDSAWNTYIKKGLPPTPICSPGLASLQASANPAKTDNVFFFAATDGTTYFAKTFAEFQKLQAQHAVNQ